MLVDDSGYPWLVDFDDCLAVGKSVDTLDAYVEHLAASPGADRMATFASRLAGAPCPP